MSQNQISAREQIAYAACDVAGKERPLGSDIPKSDRVYLYGCPESGDSQFVSDELSARLSAAKIRHGVDWDEKSKTFGVRFVSKSSKLPAEIKPFTSPEAQKDWAAWRERQADMARAVVDAARASEKGKKIDFLTEDELLEVPKTRRKARSQGERD